MKVLNSIGLWFKSLFVSVDNNEAKMKTLVKSRGFESATSSVIAAILGILVGVLIMFIVSPANAWAGFQKLLLGALGGSNKLRGLGNTLYIATPILMTGLSVGFAFKTGLFNIGATGQYTMGMFFSMITAHLFGGHWIVCLLTGMLGGAIWGFIPGIFKALLNVNEVITSIMTNYIGMFLVDMIILDVPAVRSVVYNANYGKTIALPELAELPRLGMDVLFPRSNASSGIVIAIAIAIVMFVILNKTTLGYELKACGINKHSAKYAGISQNRNIILSMVIAGALAGVGGALQIQSGANYCYTATNALEANGFTGIAVALLATSSPIGTIFAAIFFAHLQQGGLQMQGLGMSADIIDIIVGVVIYISAFALILKGIIPRTFNKIKGLIDRKIKKDETSTDSDNMGGQA